MKLTLSDIKRLASDPSVDTRTNIAGKIASSLSMGDFQENESRIAAEILRVLVHDTEVCVRREIAQQLQDALTIPSDLVLKLANDVDEVAIPLLKASYVLSEEDLIELVNSTRNVARLVAIAQREIVSEQLSEALLDTQMQEVMHALIANPGAVINDKQLLKHWSILSSHRMLLNVLVKRGGLSTVIAEKLFAVVSDELKAELGKKYNLSTVVIDEATEDVREWATLGIADQQEITGNTKHKSDVEELVQHLYISHRLTHSLIIRSLCIGDLSFFEAALAKLANVSRVNARMLLFDKSGHGFGALYKKANLPEGFAEAIMSLLEISLEITDYGRYGREDYREYIIAEIQKRGLDRSVENMQYLITLIGGKVHADEATRH